MKTRSQLATIAVALLSTLNPQLSTCFAQGTAFTYQGRLDSGGGPAQGIYDLRFTICDAASAGNVVGAPLMNSATSVTNGLFTVVLDFGSQFPGADRWLEIGVRTNGGAGFATLTPRQAITPTPYAVYSGQAGAAASAASVAWAGLSGTPAGFVDGVDNDTLYSNGAGLDLIGTTFSLNLGYLGGLYWKLGGNSGTPTGTQYLGVVDNRPLALIANNTPLLRLEPVPGGSPNISGGSAHTVGVGIQGATIGGGASHSVTADYGSIGGGVANAARAPYARVGGGILNSATGNSGVIAGGEFNSVAAADASLVGGARNRIGTNAGFAFLGGGRDNEITDGAVNGVLAGGRDNTNRANSGVLAGGSGNLVEGAYASVLGGAANRALGTAPTVGGGLDNRSTGDYSTIPGGRGNRAAGSHSFAAGQLAEASHSGAFVWADASSGTFASTSDHQFLIRAIGGVGIGTNAPAAALHVAGTVKASVFDGNGGGLFDLSASQLTSGIVPEARLSGNVALRNASQTFTGANAFPGPGNMFNGTFTGNGASLTNINAGALIGLLSAAQVEASTFGTTFWKADGNAGTSSGTHFLGTTDSQPLELRAGNQRVLRLETVADTGQGGTTVNVLGGNAANIISNGIVGAFIGGGGSSSQPNRVGGHYASVLGGANNLASGPYAVATGVGSKATGERATAMGSFTIASGDYSTALGDNSQALGPYTTAMGRNTLAVNSGATALGQNTVAAGANSMASGFFSQAFHPGAFVWADFSNSDPFTSTGDNQFLIRALGGVGINTTDPNGATLAVNGSVTATALTVNGSVTTSSLAAGGSVTATAFSGNGSSLTALSASQLTSGTMPDARLSANVALRDGGNSFTGNQLFTSGSVGIGITPQSTLHVNGTARIQGNNNWGVSGGEGDFRVGNDSYRFKIGVANSGGGVGDVWMRAHGGIERVNLKAPGGTRILSNEAETSGVSLAPGGTAWAVISDRNVKKDFAAVDSGEILEKLTAMPITQWRYNWESPGVTPHIGPMAQDFKAAFYPGTDDKSITTQEADGVALAAIQGLNEKVEDGKRQAESRIERLEQTLQEKQTEITELRQTVDELKELVTAMNHKLNGGAQ